MSKKTEVESMIILWTACTEWFRAHSGAALRESPWDAHRMGFGSSCFDLLIHLQRINRNLTWDHSLQFSSAHAETQFFLEFAVGKMHISVFGLALRRQSLLTESIGSKSPWHLPTWEPPLVWPSKLWERRNARGNPVKNILQKLWFLHLFISFSFKLEVDFVTASGNAKWRCHWSTELLNFVALRASPNLIKSFKNENMLRFMDHFSPLTVEHNHTDIIFAKVYFYLGKWAEQNPSVLVPVPVI